jgi:hypothetical protein
MNVNRSMPGLLYFAALYHDAGKPGAATHDADGRVRFIGHERLSAHLVEQRASDWHLSNVETERMKSIVTHHMRPHFLAQVNTGPSRKAIYRFFKSSGESGIDVCLLALADTLAIYEHTLPVEVWVRRLEVVRELFTAWWENPAVAVAPEPVVNGGTLIRELNLPPGPRIGVLLEAIREGQAAGTVQNEMDALILARQLLKDDSKKGNSAKPASRV